MHIILDNGITVLSIVAQCSPLPFIGPAALALAALVQSCDNIKVQKEQAKQLIKRCAAHLILLQDNAQKLEGTDLQSAADELEFVVRSITKKVQQWTQYNLAKAYYKQNAIAESLQLYLQELQRLETNFQIKCHIDTRAAIRDDAAIAARDNAEIKDLLLRLISNQQNINDVREVEAEGIPVAERLMEDGEEELYRQPRDSLKYLEYQRGLLNLHQATGVLPAMADLSDQVQRQGTTPVIGGTYSDVWIGLWHGQKKVALKGLRNIRVSKAAEKRFNQEIKVWSKLKHENILPLLGFVKNLGPHIHTVSPWQANGNALEFAKMNPNVDRIVLLLGASKGLDYLHGCHIVHGNVKCSNILINDEGVACVCDFGLSMIVGEITDTTPSATLTAQGSARWLAPELIEGIVSTPSFPSDVYSFSMAILELLTLQHPFANRKRDAAVIKDVVLNRAVPPRPRDCVSVSDNIWNLMLTCWNVIPTERPVMRIVSNGLECTLSRSVPATNMTLSLDVDMA